MNIVEHESHTVAYFP